MSKTYEWRIIDSAIIPSKDGMNNIVHKVHYIKKVVEEIDGKKYEAEFPGEAKIPSPDPANFSPINELTTEVVSGWLESLLPQEFINSRLDGMLAYKKRSDNFVYINPPFSTREAPNTTPEKTDI
jgi:hypothetical protein